MQIVVESTDSPQTKNILELILFDALFAVIDEDHPTHKSQQIRWKHIVYIFSDQSWDSPNERTNERTNEGFPERKNEPNLKGQSPCLPDVGPDEGILRCGSPGSTKFP
jgi:hypothetical protein